MAPSCNCSCFPGICSCRKKGKKPLNLITITVTGLIGQLRVSGKLSCNECIFCRMSLDMLSCVCHWQRACTYSSCRACCPLQAQLSGRFSDPGDNASVTVRQPDWGNFMQWDGHFYAGDGSRPVHEAAGEPQQQHCHNRHSRVHGFLCPWRGPSARAARARDHACPAARCVVMASPVLTILSL